MLDSIRSAFANVRLWPLALAAALTLPLSLHAQATGTAPWLATFWPVVALAVPTAVSAGWQWLKKNWLTFLDRLPPFVQRLAIATGTGFLATVGAHFGADLTGVSPDSPEGVTLIIMSVLSSFGIYDTTVKPTKAAA